MLDCVFQRDTRSSSTYKKVRYTQLKHASDHCQYLLTKKKYFRVPIHFPPFFPSVQCLPGCRCTPPSASIPTCGDGSFASSLLSLSMDSPAPLSPCLHHARPATATAASALLSPSSSLSPPPSAGLLLTKSLASCARGLIFFGG